MKKISVICLIIALVVAAVSCEKFLPKAPADDEILDGPLDGLSAAEKATFLRGDKAFNDDIFTTE
ncbi:MAG TPA: thiol oxidoreductase, partial [Chitinophagaceae bacterium]|nr:thiol oxidoreductase [Chitinophagaceae bacterium]